MSLIDWIIVALYAMIVIGIGIYANSSDFFKGKSLEKESDEESKKPSKGLPWWAIGISLIATSFSAASLLGGPAQGYNNGFLYLQLQLGDLIGFGLVILVFLPFFMKLNITTAYEYLEKRFDAKTRSFGSICFLLFVIARLGGLLYAAALVVSTVTELPLYLAILIVGIISIVYTVLGGMTAIVWTDVLQFAMIFVGLIVGIWVAVSGVSGGFDELWRIAGEEGKTRIFDLSWNPKSIYTLPTALFAYGILAFGVAGTNQQSVQRYVSCEDENSARKAILLGWFSGFIGVAATLFLGVLLFSFYNIKGGLPDDVQGDGILAHFIVNHVPPGASGLLVAAIFSAAMSSIDSALHSLATCMTVDFYDRYSKSKNSESQSVKVAQVLIIIWGIFGILSAFYVASTKINLLEFLVKYSTMFLGPLLGIFLMGVLVPRINANGAFYGTVTAVILLIVGTEMGWLSFPGIWRSAITAPFAIILGLGISLLGNIPPDRSIIGLTLFTQNDMPRPGLDYNE